MRCPKVAELREMTEEKLIEAYDEISETTYIGTNLYLQELVRRNQNRQTEAMLKYTRYILWMTIVVTVATIVNVAIASIPLIK
jgi:hypothetical protein